MRVAVAAVLSMICFLTGCGDTTTSTPDPVDRGTSSTPEPAEALPDLCPPVGSPAAVGKNALPDLSLHCLGSDERRALRKLSGRPLVLNFWASWCGPCKGELPLLARAHREHGDAISFVGIDVQDASGEAWKVLRAAYVEYPQLEDPRGITRAPFRWNSGLPLTVFVDERGRMVGTERTSFQTYAEVAAALKRHLGTAPKDVNR